MVEGPGNSYRMHGYYEFIGSMGKNSLTSGLRGPVTVEFHDGGKLRFNVMDFRLGGTIYGDRTIDLVGSMVVEDLTNALRAVVVMGTFKRAGLFSKSSGDKSEISGVVYKVRPDKLKQTEFGRDQKLPEDLTDRKSVV